ncbi:hypothetical protein F2Q70_00012401 [Brassica cretica]|uniref:Uncharacterized protein n=1 Tax=Brassica cretica TaxID=69181 RepID=A0A8S9MAJ9_BRACR|nr:hypothetical protein F2Q70_00012401 [Brassica cretica]
MQHMVDTHAVKAMDLYLSPIFLVCDLWVTLKSLDGVSVEEKQRRSRMNVIGHS